MPLYEYECRKCRHEWEQDLPIAKRNRARCPKCKAGKPYPILSANSLPTSMTRQTGMTTLAEVEARDGKQWRETPGSIRMMTGEPERLYGGPGMKSK